MVVGLSEHFGAMKVVVALVQVPDNRIASGEVMNLVPCGFHGIDFEFIEFEFPIRVLRVRVQIKLQFHPVVRCQGTPGRVLKELIAESTPKPSDDHPIFLILVIKNRGMGLKQKIKQLPGIYNFLLAVLNRTTYFNWSFHRRFRRYKLTPYWQQRINIVQASADNARISRVPDAGKVFPEYQLLANGLKITLGSYYDYGNTHLLIANRGVHEPQEEYAFEEVLKAMPPGATMMELGSYWAFYSMWFASTVSAGRCIMVEPDPHKMNFGRLNFKLNGLSGSFDMGLITDAPNMEAYIPSYSVDYLMEKHHVSHLNILHSDIQGYELAMLKGCRHALRREAIDYFFISTHTNNLHTDCIELLQEAGYTIVCDANLDESFSVDGLIVAKRKGAAGPERIEISRRK